MKKSVGIEIDSGPLETLFEHAPLFWERNPHHHNTWQRLRSITIPQQVTVIWNSSEMTEAETESVGVMNGYELRRIKIFKEQVAVPTVAEWTITDYTHDGRALSPYRSIPKRYGYSERRLSIGRSYDTAPPQLQPVKGTWYPSGVESDFLDNYFVNVEISFGARETTEPRLFVANEGIAARLTDLLDKLGDLQRAA